MYYLDVLHQEGQQHWGGKDGTIANIMSGLRLTCCREVVCRVLIETDIAVANGAQYLGDITAERGQPDLLIKNGSKEQEILVNFRERGCSYTLITVVLNIYRFCENKFPIG